MVEAVDVRGLLAFAAELERQLGHVPHHRPIAHYAESATANAANRAVRIARWHLARTNGLPSSVSQGGIDQGQAWPFRTKVPFILTLSIKRCGRESSIGYLPIPVQPMSSGRVASVG